MIGVAATESLSVDGLNIALLSDEELEVMADEAGEAKAEGDDNLGEAERFLQVTDAMEDTADVLEANGETMGEDITPAEAALVDAGAQSAVAGTDTPEEEIIPAMEAYVGQNRRLAVESIREKASQLYDTVIKFLKKVWENIEKFFYKYVGEIPLLRRKLEALKKRVEEIGSKSLKKDGGKNFKITSGTGMLMVDNAPVKDVAALTAALATTETMAAYVFGDYAENVKKRGEKLVDCIGDFDEDKAEEVGKKAITELNGARYKVPGSVKDTTERFSGYSCYIGAGMLNNKSLAQRYWKDLTDTSVAASLNRSRYNSLLLLPTVEKPKDAPSDITFTTMSNAEMSKTISKLEKLLDLTEQFRRGSKFKNMKEVRSKMETASNKAKTAMKKMEDKEDRDVAATAIFKELINLNIGYANWVKEPIESMIQQTLASVRTSMMVVAKSCGQYE